MARLKSCPFKATEDECGSFDSVAVRVRTVPHAQDDRAKACAGFDRGFAADLISRKIGLAWPPGLRLGLASVARYAGWMVGLGRGFAVDS